MGLETEITVLIADTLFASLFNFIATKLTVLLVAIATAHDAIQI
jgi:hypothetical protein